MALPDLEAWAIFAKVVEARSFAAAATELGLSKASVSKAVTRLEARLGTRLLNRTSRRLALTETGRQLSQRAFRILAEAESAEAEAAAQSAAPRGALKIAAPMSFGIAHLAPALPDFLSAYPDIVVDLHLSDAVVDLVGGGFDAALRIAALPDSSLIAKRLCVVERLLVASPAYLAARGQPAHPRALAEHACFSYSYLATPDVWRLVNATGEEVLVRPHGPLRVNNADAQLPALRAGLGLALLPDFIVAGDIARGVLAQVLPDWRLAPIALHLVTPAPGPRPAKLDAFADFVAARFARPAWRAAT